MPIAGHLNAQFGSYNAAAAVRWITGNANLHEAPRP
jgi:hypothetical protein